MSINAQQFNGIGNANLIPGMVLESGAETTSGIYSLNPNLFSFVTVPQANVFVAGNFNVIVTQNVSGRVLNSLITQGLALDPLLAVSLLAQALSPMYNVSFAASAFTITAKTPGSTGLFSIVLPGGTFNSNAVVDPLPLLPGRIVVNDNTLWTGDRNSFNQSVVYPTTVNSTSESLGGAYVTGFGDFINVAPSPFDYSQDGSRVPVCNVVELYIRAGALVMQCMTPISAFAPVFVETSTANLGVNTGKLTGTASVTTIALTSSRLRIVQGTAIANGMVIVQLK